MPQLLTQDQLEKISPREKEVLRLVYEGHGSLKISDLIFISEDTVNDHIYSGIGKIEDQLSIKIPKRSVAAIILVSSEQHWSNVAQIKASQAELAATISEPRNDGSNSAEIPQEESAPSAETTASRTKRLVLPGSIPDPSDFVRLMERKSVVDRLRGALDEVEQITTQDRLEGSQRAALLWIAGPVGTGKSCALVQLFKVVTKEPGAHPDADKWANLLSDAVTAASQNETKRIFLDDAFGPTYRDDAGWKSLVSNCCAKQITLVVSGPSEHREAFRNSQLNQRAFHTSEVKLALLSEEEQREYIEWFLETEYFSSRTAEWDQKQISRVSGNSFRHANFCLMAWLVQMFVTTQLTLDQFCDRLRASYSSNPQKWDPMCALLCVSRLGIAVPSDLYSDLIDLVPDFVDAGLVPRRDDGTRKNIHPAIAAELHNLLRQLRSSELDVHTIVDDLAKVCEFSLEHPEVIHQITKVIFLRETVADLLGIAGEKGENHASRRSKAYGQLVDSFASSLKPLIASLDDKRAAVFITLLSKLASESSSEATKACLGSFSFDTLALNPRGRLSEGASLAASLRWNTSSVHRVDIITRSGNWIRDPDNANGFSLPRLIHQVLLAGADLSTFRIQAEQLVAASKEVSPIQFAGDEHIVKWLSSVLPYFACDLEDKALVKDAIRYTLTNRPLTRNEATLYPFALKVGQSTDWLKARALTRISTDTPQFLAELCVEALLTVCAHDPGVKTDAWKFLEKTQGWHLTWLSVGKAARNSKHRETKNLLRYGSEWTWSGLRWLETNFANQNAGRIYYAFFDRIGHWPWHSAPNTSADLVVQRAMSAAEEWRLAEDDDVLSAQALMVMASALSASKRVEPETRNSMVSTSIRALVERRDSLDRTYGLLQMSIRALESADEEHRVQLMELLRYRTAELPQESDIPGALASALEMLRNLNKLWEARALADEAQTWFEWHDSYKDPSNQPGLSRIKKIRGEGITKLQKELEMLRAIR